MTSAVGLDFNAPLALARALGADDRTIGLLAETLPDAEAAILAGLRDTDGSDE